MKTGSIKIHNKELRIENLLILTALLYFLVLYRNLEIHKMWAFGDLIGFPTDIRVVSDWTFHLWNQEGLGLVSFTPFNYNLTMLVASLVFGSFLAQKILLLSMPIVSFITFFSCLRKFDVNTAGSLLGALAYSVNPLTISELVGGSMTLAIYSIFPLIFLYVIRTIQCQSFRLKDVVVLGLLGFFAFNVHATFWYMLLLIPPLLISVRPFAQILKKTAVLAIPLIIIVLILLPNIIGYFRIYEVTTWDQTAFESETAYSYADATFYNIVRLAGNRGSAQAKEFLNFNTVNSYTVWGYAITIIAFLFPFVKWHDLNQKKKILTLSMVVSFVASVGLILLVRFLPSIVNLHPVLTSLRNPGKLIYPLSFSLCLLFSVGVEQLLMSVNRRHNVQWRIVIASILLILVLFYNYPALDGTMGLSQVRDNSYYLNDKYYVVTSVLQGIDKDYTSYRVLLLPWDYSTQIKFGGILPNYFGVYYGSELFPNVNLLRGIFELFAARNSSERGYLLGLFDVKYVVIEKSLQNDYNQQADPTHTGRSYVIYDSNFSYWAAGEPEYYYEIFRSDPNFELLFEDSNFAILRNKVVVTRIHTRSSAVNLILSYATATENLLSNPSFDNQTEYWQTWPGNLITAKNGEGTLLGQEKWWTNLGQTIPVNENVLYRLRFSVKGYNITDMHAKVLWYNATESFTEGNAFVDDFINLYQMGLKEGEWSNIEKVFTAPKGAKAAMIWFGANRLMNYTNTTMYVDDVSFNEVEMTIENFDEVFSSITNINYSQINPTRFIARTNASDPLVIALSAAYDPSWVCYTNGQKSRSFPLYGVVNGFWINQTGQLDIIIEYEPQKWFFIGSVVSAATLVACLAYLGYDYSKSKTILKRIKTVKLRREKEKHIRQRRDTPKNSYIQFFMPK